MEVREAAQKVLTALHYDINGRLTWSRYLEQQTVGYNDSAAFEIKGTFNKALIVLIDEDLARRTAENNDIIEITQKGIDAEGDFMRHHKKKSTRVFLEKARRIAPILSFIIVLISFIIGLLKKNASDKAKLKAKTTQTTKDAKPKGK
jgi:hypothetical protein